MAYTTGMKSLAVPIKVSMATQQLAQAVAHAARVVEDARTRTWETTHACERLNATIQDCVARLHQAARGHQPSTFPAIARERQRLEVNLHAHYDRQHQVTLARQVAEDRL